MTNQAIMSRTKGGFLADRATRHVREKMCRRSSDLSMSSMSFASGSFDLVLSNTVIEHVGDSENQKRFLSECVRIAKRLHRAILNELSMNFFAREENPILLSKRDLLSLTEEARRLPAFSGGGGEYACSPDTERFLGFISNLPLFVGKR
ncbi:MAG: class I SAM-dependent methyltransferase [Candidatus Accumulibacter sp.]|jgi:hypothetical protein|nr:class I SAM-dependent methyltransferase [Accumulibacter sp.]